MHFHRLLAYWGGAVFAAATFAQGVPEPDVAKGEQLATQVCAACHAPDGNSVQPANPVLAGQHSEYTFKQLSNFKPQNGRPAERPNPIMAGMVANLTAEDMSSLAAYFQTQKPALRAARDADLVRLGQAIYRGGILSRNVAACTACHGPGGAGVPAQFPRIAGQFAEYTAAQLRAFRSGERANDPNRMMRAVAERLSDREIAAVAEYISGLR
jgi:cytochrome c553